MVPPFLAYYGVLTQNQTLVEEAYDQCRLYRQHLVDDDAGGMWKHIAGNNTDNGHWTTGESRTSIEPAHALEFTRLRSIRQRMGRRGDDPRARYDSALTVFKEDEEAV